MSLWSLLTYHQNVVRPSVTTFGPTKGRKLCNVITNNIILAFNKIKAAIFPMQAMLHKDLPFLRLLKSILLPEKIPSIDSQMCV